MRFTRSAWCVDFPCVDVDVWRKFWFQWIQQLNAPLEVIDPEIADIIELEKARQWKVDLDFRNSCVDIHLIELSFEINVKILYNLFL